MNKQIVTWDASTSSSEVTLSNGNLTVISSSTHKGARSTIGKSSGRWYCEFTLNSTGSVGLGIVESSVDLKINATAISGLQTIRMYQSYGTPKKYPENVSYGSTYLANDVISLLLDLDNGILEFWKNGVTQGISHANLSTMNKPVYILFSNSAGTIASASSTTANFGATSFKYIVPSGYSSYDTVISNKFLISSGDEYQSISGGYYLADTAIPQMKSNDLPNGTAKTSSINTTYDAWKAFDRVSTSPWIAVSGFPQWLSYEFSSPKIIAKYGITQSSGYMAVSPKDWVFQGSNDGVNWTVLDTRVGVLTASYTADIEITFQFINTTPYRTYRINVSGGNGGTVMICELKMYEYIPKTLKILDSLSELNFIGHGVDKSYGLNLSETIVSKTHIKSTPITLGSGRVFKQSIDTSKIPIKKVSIT